MYEVKVESQSPTADEAPFSIPEVTRLIQKYTEEQSEEGLLDNDLNTSILTKLQSISSKYKFLCQSAQIHPSDSGTNDFDIVANFGAVWDEAKDGYVSFRLDEENKDVTLVSIYWLYIG